MPSVREQSTNWDKGLTARERCSIEGYCNPDSGTYNNWAQSYKAAGYSQCKGWEINAVKVLGKGHIKEAVRLYRAETHQIWAHDKQTAIDGLNRNLLRALIKADNGDIGAIQAITAIYRELDAISGLSKQVIVTEQQTPTLTDTEQQAVDEQAHDVKLRISRA